MELEVCILIAAEIFMINRRVLKRVAVSQRVLELSCTQTHKQTFRFTSADPLASLIAQPTSVLRPFAQLVSGSHDLLACLSALNFKAS